MATVHVAGTSCAAFASNGKQLGIRDSTVLPFLAWVALRMILQEPVLLHENSTRFPVKLLDRFFGHLYIIEEADCDLFAYGAPVRRNRKLTRMYHKVKVMLCGLPFSRFNVRFFQMCNFHWKSFFFQHLLDDKLSKDCFFALLCLLLDNLTTIHRSDSTTSTVCKFYRLKTFST